jgi:uncharacterized membrane protein YedE/YeeE
MTSLALAPTSQNTPPVLLASALSLLLLIGLAISIGWRQSALFAVGLSAGVILYHAAFGFTAAWREVVNTGRGAGLRAQMLMLGITVLVFTPLIALGEVGGISLRGSVAPLSVGVIGGAFIFGIGMQLGGGCASGTLFTVGGGNARMIITLAAFIAGSVLGSYHWGLWQAAPALPAVALSTELGVVGAIVVSLGLFAAVWFATVAWEKHKHGAVRSDRDTVAGYTFLRGPWPLIAGGFALAGVNIATLLIAGRPWGVTSAFALWGAKILTFVGVDVTGWDYWARSGSLASLHNSVFADSTSVMNFGIMLGALLAAGLAGNFSPTLRIPPRSVMAAIIGGLLLGYGARIAYGCNIGAYFGGISSTSLHGWLWFVAAFIGSSIGVRLRGWFGLG